MSPKKKPQPAPEAPSTPPTPPPPSLPPEIAQVPPPNPEDAAVAEHKKELDSELQSIYDQEGSSAKPDMTRLDQARHSTIRKVLIGLMVFFAVLAAVSWAGVFFFTGAGAKFSGEGVKLEIEGPTEVKSGELVTYGIRYENGEKIALGTSQMEVRLPKSFKVQSTEPASGEDGWSIGSIAPGKDGIITIKGVFIAPIDREFDLQAILTYRPADFNSEFQKVSTKGIKIAGSVIDLSVTGPPKVLPGDKVTVTYAFKNASDSSFEHLKLHGLYPPTFIPETTDPATVDSDMKEWDIAKLDPGAEGKVSVTGSFSSDAEGAQEVKGQVGFLGPDDEFQLQKEASFSADVLKGDLVTALILNGKADAQPLRFGDMLRYAVTYKNTGTVTLGDVVLTVTLDDLPQGKVVDWTKLEDRAKGVRDGNKISWSKKQVPSLAKVEAGEEGTLDFQVPTIDKPIEGSKEVDYQVTSWLEASIGSIDNAEVSRTAKTAPIVAKMVSDAAFAAEARYFNADNIPVGSGPLPPKVGQATTYRVFWTLTNSLHELTDLKISAKLPPNVTWTGLSKVDAGTVQFDAADEKMIWTLNWMPVTIKTLSISFDVAITPTEDQKGKSPTLVDGAIFEAIDKRNGWPILLSWPPLTTALENDTGAAGKGKVE